MTDRNPRPCYFVGRYIIFKKVDGKSVYSIYNQLPFDKPIFKKCGDYIGQDLAELAKPYLLNSPYKTILGETK